MRGRMRASSPTSVQGSSSGGGDGVPAGAVVFVDSMSATVRAAMSETNAAPTDTMTAQIRASMSETNATPTDTMTARAGTTMVESNATPADSLTFQLKYAASTTFQVPTGVTSLTARGWGSGRAGSGGTSLAAGAGGPGADLVQHTFAVTPGETLTITVGASVAGAAANAAGAAGQDTTISRGGTVLFRARGAGSANANVGTLLAAGTAASGATGGSGGTSGTQVGGTGGAAPSGSAAGGAGNPPGGGGAGGGANLLGTPGAGGASGRGEARLTW